MHIIQKSLFCLCLSVWYHAQNLEDFTDFLYFNSYTFVEYNMSIVLRD